jgi:hypothetical protein
LHPRQKVGYTFGHETEVGTLAGNLPSESIPETDTETTSHGGVTMSARKRPIALVLQEKQQKRLRRLKRQHAQSVSSDSSHVVIDPPGLEKMSDVLEEFVDPWMTSAETTDGYRRLLTLGMAAWNAALLPADKRAAFIEELAGNGRIPAEGRPMFRSIIQEMIDRKQAFFSENTRAIVSIELIDAGDEPYLTVASTLPAPSVSR